MSKDKERESFLRNYLVDTAAGSVSGAGAAVVTHPLDTETVRAQAGTGESKAKANFREVPNSGKGKREKIKFEHFQSPKGREKLKKIVRSNYSGLTPRLKKTMIAGAIGYPLFTGSQRVIENQISGKEKNAGFLTGATVAAKAAGRMAKGLPDFAKGVFGGNMKATKGYWAGAGTTIAAMTAGSSQKASRTIMESSVKGIDGIGKAGDQIRKNPSISTGIRNK